MQIEEITQKKTQKILGEAKVQGEIQMKPEGSGGKK